MKPERPAENYYEQEQKDVERKRDIYLQCLSDIKNNTLAQEYFKGFESKSVEQFIIKYATQKAEWIVDRYTYNEWNENDAVEWIEYGFQCFAEIQQKKLFDAQCLWRAEQITLTGIQVCYDFKYWENDILNCPAIPPVTPEEMDMYIQFLRSLNYDKHTFGFFTGWQSYQSIIETYENDEDEDRAEYFPEWYDFYNMRRGTALYMKLPDIRGGKEEFYYGLWREEQRILNQNKTYPEPRPIDHRPHLSVHDIHVKDFFVDKFEDSKTQEYYMAQRYLRGEQATTEEYDGNADTAIYKLQMAGELVPIQEHYDFRIALENAHRAYERKKIAETLPIAYQQYLMRIETQMMFDQDRYIENYVRHKEDHIQMIIRGRVLNGEPADLNF